MWYNECVYKKLSLKSDNSWNMDALFYPETIMQTTSQSSTYPFNITKTKKYADYVNNTFFWY